MKFRPPVHLEKAHEPFLESFDCGDPVLNDWLKTKAIPNEEKRRLERMSSSRSRAIRPDSFQSAPMRFTIN